MRDNVDAIGHLRFLYELSVGAHALLCVRLGECVGDEGSCVQTGQGDELPGVAEGAKALDVGFLFVAGHGLLPVEGGGEVVGKPDEVC